MSESITPNPPRQRKPRPKPARSIRVLEQPGPDTDGWAAIAITVGKQTDTYLLHTIPTDFGAGALGFEVEKLDADLATIETYHVLPSQRSAGQFAANDPAAQAEHETAIADAFTPRAKDRSEADNA
jgi:hypothetical protein